MNNEVATPDPNEREQNTAYRGSVIREVKPMLVSILERRELLPQTDLFALKSFCNNITDLPTDSLRLSGANDEAVAFLKCLLVADPISRLAAKEALQAAWMLQEDLEWTPAGWIARSSSDS